MRRSVRALHRHLGPRRCGDLQPARLHRWQRPWGCARSRALGWALILVFVSGLLGCTGIIATGPAPNLYNLTPKSVFSDDLPTVTSQIVVAEPLAAGGLDSNRIALRPTPTELKYYAGARWTERAPKMVQTLLIESLENTGKIMSVGRQAIGLRSDFDLKTELREFQAEYFGGVESNPYIRVRLNAKLIAQPRQIIVASRSFEHRLPATGSDISSIVVGFDRALGKVLKETVSWTLSSVASQERERRR